MRFLPQIIAWLLAVAWVTRTFAALRGLPTIPDLCLPAHDIVPTGAPTITVIVPARNEQQDIRACLESLLAQDYPTQIIAVDDRSTDTTGAIMDTLASNRLTPIHIAELPPQWLGKTHAMAVAAATSNSDFLLFTDADILFAPSAIRRALAHAVAERADHLVLSPTLIIRRWDEAMILAFFQFCGLLSTPAWRIADPNSKASIGMGSFNLIRSSAYRSIGGFESFPMEIAEDLGLGRRVKQARLAQRFVCGRNLTRVHWASGARGIVNGVTKNMFSVYGFRVWLSLASCLALTTCILPFIAIWFRFLTIPSALAIAAMFLGYRAVSRITGLSPWNVLLEPFAAAALIYAMLRSIVTTLRQGGVIWRGTFYPLAELRKHTTPFFARPAK